jgi:hypothetical protein
VGLGLALALVCVASPAFAQSSVPGTGGDPLREVMVIPAFVNTELPVLAIHGGNPEDTVLLLDGFELPWAFHASGVRSIVPPGAVENMDLLASGFGVEYGRGSSVLAMSTLRDKPRGFVEVTSVDATLAHVMRGFGATLRGGTDYVADRFRPAEAREYVDLIGHLEPKTFGRWTLSASGIYSDEGDRLFSRQILSTKYAGPRWTADFAVSPLQQEGPIDAQVRPIDIERNAIDTRVEFVRRASAAAGLTELEWRLGQQTNSNRYALSRTFWRHDIGGWSSVAANVSRAIRASAGVRVDSFNGDVATQPRASIGGKATNRLALALGAGAYRRPPNQPRELDHDLNPERATHVAAGATYTDPKTRINAIAYYIDRSRLVICDQLGELRNTGLGTSLGVDVSVHTRQGPWFGAVTTALTRSKRFDFLRAAERPSEYEQPFRLDVLGAYYRKNLIFSARLQLASGLPYTPFDGAIYDSDTDTYEPLYVVPLSARAPFHHQIGMRIDYRWRVTQRIVVDAFLDLHNAYRNRDAIAYRYHYDFSGRTAITALPLFPFAGLRAYL